MSDRIAVLRSGSWWQRRLGRRSRGARGADGGPQCVRPWPPREPGEWCARSPTSIAGRLARTSRLPCARARSRHRRRSGNGQQALADVLFGMGAPDAGSEARCGPRVCAPGGMGGGRRRVSRGSPSRRARRRPAAVGERDRRALSAFRETAVGVATARAALTRATSCRASTCAQGGASTRRRSRCRAATCKKLILGRALATDLADRPPPVLIVADPPGRGHRRRRGRVRAPAAHRRVRARQWCCSSRTIWTRSTRSRIARVAVIHAGRFSEAKPREDLGSFVDRDGDAPRPRSRITMRLESRGQVSRVWLVAAPFAAVAFTLVAAALCSSRGRARRWHAPTALIFEGGFGSRFAWSETLTARRR